MKRYLLIMIALFTLGQVCRAQSTYLTSGQVLKSENIEKSSGAKKKRFPRHAPGETQSYWVAGKAYFNKYGQFDVSQLTDKNYQVQVTFNGTQVSFDGLINLDGFTVTNTSTITGVYDAANKTITISTPEYVQGKPISGYTSIGTINYQGQEVGLKLFAGTFSETPNAQGQYGLSTVNELVFDVNDDLSVLTPQTGYGAYGFYTESEGSAGFLNFFKSADFYKMNDDPHLLATDTIKFKGASVTVGATLTREIMLSNFGKNGTDYTVNIQGEGLTLYASDHIDGAKTSVYKLEFRPIEDGDYTGTITFIAMNGSTAKTVVKATVSEAPDFSPIVKNGNIVFSFEDDYPFVITDTITGSPVAVSTNSEISDATTSTLNANITIPQGKTGILSWKGISRSMQPNGIKIFVDGDELYNNIYKYNGIYGIDDISNSIALSEGNHTVQFVNEIMLNWHIIGGKGELKSYLWDFNVQLKDATSNAAYQKDDAADFGRHYLDKFAVTDTATVVLLNTGSQPLKVTGFQGDGNFSGVVDNVEAEYTAALPVKILFTASAAGNYAADVVVNTTAGNFTVHCKSSVEPIINDYSPIVKQGEFSFNTSLDHPFTVAGDSAYSSIAYFNMTKNEKPVSWLEASFRVPEGKSGILSWIGHNSSSNYTVFMGDSVHNDGTIITIDGTIENKYASVVDASSSTFQERNLKFGPGLHKVKFLYRKRYSKIDKGILDRFLIRNLSLELINANGIEGVSNSEKEIVRTEIFSVSGERLGALRKGLNLVRLTYSDGTSATRKIMKE